MKENELQKIVLAALVEELFAKKKWLYPSFAPNREEDTEEADKKQESTLQYIVEYSQTIAFKLQPFLKASSEAKDTRLKADGIDFIYTFFVPLIDMLNAIKTSGDFNVNVGILEKIISGLFGLACLINISNARSSIKNSNIKLVQLEAEKLAFHAKRHDSHNNFKDTPIDRSDELDKIALELDFLKSQKDLTEEEKSRKNFLEKRVRRLVMGVVDQEGKGIDQDIINHQLKRVVNWGLGLGSLFTLSFVIGGVSVAVGTVALSFMQTIVAAATAYCYYKKMELAEERLKNFHKEKDSYIKKDKEYAEKEIRKETENLQWSELKIQAKIQAKNKEIDKKYEIIQEVLEDHLEKRQNKFNKFATLGVTNGAVFAISVVGLCLTLNPIMLISLLCVTTVILTGVMACHFKYNLDRKADVNNANQWAKKWQNTDATPCACETGIKYASSMKKSNLTTSKSLGETLTDLGRSYAPFPSWSTTPSP